MDLRVSGSGQEHAPGCCEHDNEPSDSIQCGKFLSYQMKFNPFKGGFYFMQFAFFSSVRSE
jgi:hypothetical protein